MKWLVIFMLGIILVGGIGILLHTKKPLPLAKSPQTSTIKSSMKITSSAFTDNSFLPSKFSCDGDSVNPPLTFEDIPQNAKSLALIMDDPDAPMGTYVHWVLYNMPTSITNIEEANLPSQVVLGKNSSGSETYVGACPPSGTHRYFFKLYALDTMLSLRPNATKEELLQAMEGHIVGEAQLIGLYKRE